MYPETDIPEVVLTAEGKRRLSKKLPPPWWTAVGRLQKKYGLSPELALQVYDSDHGQSFEDIAKSVALPASTVASLLVELPIRLSRESIDVSRLNSEIMLSLLKDIDRG
jgi:glutamyl-tRNA(Gln) amidotransferase subunit E